MSSRLFQRVREELGLVFPYTLPSTYRDVGLMTIYAVPVPPSLKSDRNNRELKDLRKTV